MQNAQGAKTVVGIYASNLFNNKTSFSSKENLSTYSNKE